MTIDASTAGPGGTLEGRSGSGPGGTWTGEDIAALQRDQAGHDDRTPTQRAQDDGAETSEPFGTEDGDTLSLLATKARALVEQTAKLHTVYGAGGEFAIKCTTDISERQIRRWQRAALPPHKRKGGAQVGMFDMDQRVLALLCLNETGRELYVHRDNDQWARIPTAETGSIFDTKTVKDAFGVLDQNSVLNRIFGGRDGVMIRAATEVMAAAGWADSVADDDDDDEYAELDPRTGP